MLQFANKANEEHLKIAKFFKNYKFGSNMPILTYLSYLKPIDRVYILENVFLFEEDIFSNQLNNIFLIDKLVLAYVKIGRIDLAEEIIDYARQHNASKFDLDGMKFKLKLPIPTETSQQKRLDLLNNDLSKTKNTIEINFLNSLIKFVTNSI